MKQKERHTLEELYTDACSLYAAGTRRDPQNEAFLRGYEWGINRVLKALGYSWTERWNLWHTATHEATRQDHHDITE